MRHACNENDALEHNTHIIDVNIMIARASFALKPSFLALRLYDEKGIKSKTAVGFALSFLFVNYSTAHG